MPDILAKDTTLHPFARHMKETHTSKNISKTREKSTSRSQQTLKNYNVKRQTPSTMQKTVLPTVSWEKSMFI